jgi:hypothetical protein
MTRLRAMFMALFAATFPLVLKIVHFALQFAVVCSIGRARSQALH